MRVARARTTLATALVLLAAACGGGGGPGDEAEPLTNADFVGTYFLAHLAGTGAAGVTSAAVGPLVADGLGAADVTATLNEDGDVDGPTPFAFTYEVDGDGTFDLLSEGDPFQQGGLARDGEAALLAGLVGAPSVTVLLRREGVHDAGSLTGQYHVAAFFGQTDGGSRSVGGTASFDGVDAGRFDTVASNLMGVTSLVVFDFTYAVASDGASSLVGGGQTLAGSVGLGGEVAVWGGPVTDGRPPTLFLALRTSQGVTPATFRGDYWAVSFARELGTSQFAARLGTATADGQGNVRLQLVANRNGTLVLPPEDTALTYDVGSNGALVLNGPELFGGLTEDGRFAVLGGGVLEGSDPTVLVLRRKE
jgi:hypothetical protein